MDDGGGAWLRCAYCDRPARDFDDDGDPVCAVNCEPPLRSKAAIDRRGRRFGRLVAVAYAGSNAHGRALWRCRCDCGGEHTAPSSDLVRGRVRSCGCLVRDAARERASRPVPDGVRWRRFARGKAVHDLRGQRYGRLVVRAFAGVEARGGARWVCACDCGSPPKSYAARNLTTLSTRSCGCLARERRGQKRASA